MRRTVPILRVCLGFGNVAKKARLELERKTKRPVISKENYLDESEKEKRKRLPEPEKD